MSHYTKVVFSVSVLIIGVVPLQATANDGSGFSVGLGSATHSNLKFNSQSNSINLKRVTTFQQNIGLTHRLVDADTFSLDALGELEHESGTADNYTVDGVVGSGSAQFDRQAAFADVKLAYKVSTISPYVGVGLGGVHDTVSLPEAQDYKSNYLAGKAFVGAEWHSKSGFGLDLRASTIKRVD